MTPLLAQRPRTDRAFERMYKRHVGDVYRYALAVMRNPGEAEVAISRQLDGRLPRQERGQLRAHLRECSECASFARRQRAQRGALKSLALVPVPGSLSSFFGGGGAAVGTGLALKAAGAVTAGLAIGGAGVATVEHAPWKSRAAAASAAPIFQ